VSEKLNQELRTTNILWNLTDLYSNTTDPAIAADLDSCTQEAETIDQQYSGKVARLSAEQLLDLVTRLERLETLAGKLSTFAYLNFATQTKEQTAGAFLQKIKEVLSRISTRTVFFELEWNKLEEEKAAELLADGLLAHYQHYLASLRRYTKHLLSQAEEALLLEKAPVGRSSWMNLFDKVLGHMTFGEKGRSEEEVLADLYNMNREVRKQAAADLSAGLAGNLHILTHIFNTLLADKMIDDRLRCYQEWISSMNLYNELEDQTVRVLVEAVISRYDIPQRYYRIKRQLMGLDELMDYDRYSPLPLLSATMPDSAADDQQTTSAAPAIPWDKCRSIVLDAFADFAPQMAEIASQFFERRWIHAPLLDGKRGGAFAHPCVPEVHPYIMVNYTGNIRDVSTVAHELGHGIHQYLAADKGYYNSGTTLVLAETASVFAELLVFHNQLELLTDKNERRAFICQKLESIFATVFRQISMNQFEDRVHNERRVKGELSSELISEHWRATQTAMFGDTVTLSQDYGIWWSYIPHFLSTPGYVYSYAFGELLVMALYHRYQQDKAQFIPRYLDLLKAGGSDSPYRLLAPFGIDLNDQAFWQGGLEMIDDMLKLVE